MKLFPAAKIQFNIDFKTHYCFKQEDIIEGEQHHLARDLKQPLNRLLVYLI